MFVYAKNARDVQLDCETYQRVTPANVPYWVLSAASHSSSLKNFKCRPKKLSEELNYLN